MTQRLTQHPHFDHITHILAKPCHPALCLPPQSVSSSLPTTTYLNTMRRPMTPSFALRPTDMEPCCMRLTMLRPEPFPTLTGRRIAQSLSGSSIQSLRRSKRSIPLTYPSSDQVLSFTFVMRIWRSTPMDLSYIQLVGGEERCPGASLDFISASSNFTSILSPLIAPSLSLCERCTLRYQTT